VTRTRAERSTGRRDARARKAPLPTRERLLAAAIRLFQTRGYDATGVADILEAARAPKGSLYHHFPEGKEQIAEAAIRSIAAAVDRLIAERRAAGTRAADIVRGVASGMAEWSKRTGWNEGGLLAALAQAAPRSPRLQSAVRRVYAGWRAALAEAIAADGIGEKRSAELALLAIAALEGGFVLARVERRGSVLLETTEEVARLLEASATRRRASPR
jgi:TetR/AcrR family transcriptional repressor of lmrAB and yxaGH operons